MGWGWVNQLSSLQVSGLSVKDEGGKGGGGEGRKRRRGSERRDCAQCWQGEGEGQRGLKNVQLWEELHLKLHPQKVTPCHRTLRKVAGSGLVVGC